MIPPIPAETRAQVVELRRAGKSYREIHDATGVSTGAISRILAPQGLGRHACAYCDDPKGGAAS